MSNHNVTAWTHYQVAVCGPGGCTDQDRANARRIGDCWPEVGNLLAEAGAVVICGGRRRTPWSPSVDHEAR